MSYCRLIILHHCILLVAMIILKSYIYVYTMQIIIVWVVRIIFIRPELLGLRHLLIFLTAQVILLFGQ